MMLMLMKTIMMMKCGNGRGMSLTNDEDDGDGDGNTSFYNCNPRTAPWYAGHVDGLGKTAIPTGAS